MKDKKPFVILTVPHAKCIQNPKIKHSCDYIAPASAHLLSEELTKHDIDNVIIYGDINRESLDLNREESESTIFQQQINKNIAFHKDNDLYLIDVHSGGFESGIPLLILEHKSDLEIPMISELQQQFPDISILEGDTDKNYNVKKARDNNIKNILLEFNEDYQFTPQTYQKVVKSIRKTIFNR